MVRNRRAEKQKKQLDVIQLLDDPEYTERSSYEKTISSVERVFAAEDILYLFYELLFRQESIQKLCEFLGLPYMPAEFGRVVLSGGERDVMPALLEQQLRTRFEPTYSFCRSRFGDSLPEGWRR